MAVKNGQEQQGEQGGTHQPADDHNGKGFLDFRARAAGEKQGHQAQGSDGGGHEHRAQTPLRPIPHHLIQGQALGLELVEIGDHYHPVQHRNTQEGDEAHGGGHGQVLAGNEQGQHATHQGEGDHAQDQTGLTQGTEGGKEEQENQPQGHGHHQHEALGGPLLVFKLAAPDNVITGGQLDFLGHPGLGVLDEADQIPAPHIGLDDHVALGVFPIHLHRPFHPLQTGHLGQGHGASIGQGKAQVGKAVHAGLEVSPAPQQHRGAPSRLHHLTGGETFQQGLEGVLDLFHGQAQAAHRQPVQIHLQVLDPGIFLGEGVFRSRHGLDDGHGLVRQLVEPVQVRTENFDGDVPPYPGKHFRNPHVDGLGEAVGDAREVGHDPPHLVREPILVRLTPLVHGLEHQEGIRFIEAHGVQADFIRPYPGDDFFHLRHPGQDGFLDAAVHGRGVIQADGGQLFQLHDHVPLVHGGQEGLAQQGVGPRRQGQEAQGAQDHGLGVAEGPGLEGGVGGVELFHQPGFMVFPLAHEQGGQGRNHGQGQHQGGGQGEDDGQGHGDEELAFQAFQGEQGEKDDDDDGDAGGHGQGHFPDRPIDHVEQGQTGLVGGLGEVGFHVFHNHHGPVHQHADGDGQAPQTHEIGGEAEPVHENEGEQGGEGQNQGDHQGRPEIAEEGQEQEDDQHNGFPQGFRHRAHGPLHQVAPVVEGLDGDALGQGFLDFRQLVFDPGHHLLGVGAPQA